MLKLSCLFLACAFLQVTFASKIIDPLRDLPYTLFDPSLGALCLDGTPAGYASRQASKTSLVLQLPGGGWCFNGDMCLTRSNTSLGSSNSFKDQILTVGEGELSGNATDNPHFYTFSAINPIYCDGGCFAGVKDDVVDGTNLYSRGRHNLEATLDVVLDTWGFKDTLEEIIVSGCSAGGLATYLNVDHIHQYVSARLTHTNGLKTRAFGNAGWFMDTNSLTWDGDAWSGVRILNILLTF